MELFSIFLLALSAVAALMCIIELVMIYMERATEKVRTIDILSNELTKKTREVLLLRALGLILFAAVIVGAAVIYDLFFFSEKTLLVPVVFLAASALLVYLLIRHIRYVRYLILCCAMQAVRKQREKTIANYSDFQ